MEERPKDDESALRHFFGRTTRASEGKIRDYRDKLCTRTRGNSIFDCYEDLVAHGIRNEVEAKKVELRQKADVNVLAVDPISTSRYEYAKNINTLLEEELRPGTGDAGSNLLRWFVIGMLSILVAVYCTSYNSNISNPRCTKLAMDRLRDSLEKASVGLDFSMHEKLEYLERFGEIMTYDWTDPESILEPPKHSANLRIEGNDSDFINSFFISFLRDWLGDCFESHVFLIDMEKSRQEIHREIFEFMDQSKRHDRNEMVLFVFQNCFGGDASMKAMTLKDFMYLDPISILEHEISARGVGFVLLGGSMDDETCEQGDVTRHDKLVNGWFDSVLGRMTFQISLCK